MDGADALAFSNAVRHAAVIAFEPNPVNLLHMKANAALHARKIGIVPVAVTDRDGEADFFLVGDEPFATNDIRGMSSLYRRGGKFAPSKTVRIRTVNYWRGAFWRG
jgi:FkbM family methyltransferase